MQQVGEERGVALTHTLEAPIEPSLKSTQQTSPGAIEGIMALAPEQEADDDRRQRPREPIGSEHRENHCEPERRKQVFRGALEENDRGEHATDGERRNQGRHRDAGSALKRRLRQGLAFLGEQAMGILDRHRRVVDQNSDCESEPAERHGVERLAKEIEDDQRRQDGQWN
jgi:hypothetical protein